MRAETPLQQATPTNAEPVSGVNEVRPKDALGSIDPSATLSPSIGPYRLVRVLGHGGMGVVYEAVHSVTGARVAIKVATGDSEQSQARLRAEIAALECVNHPGIVRLVHYGLDGPVHFYAMDLVEGRNWEAYADSIWHSSPPQRGRGPRLAANGRLPEVLQCARSVAEALEYLHGLGFVHCDVSPRNVLVRDDGTTVLMDLGLVSRHRGAVGPDVLEPAGTPVGTIGYMAPEQAWGLSIDARADLFSLGALIYRAVVGRVPARGECGAMSAVVDDVPAGLDTLVEQLLSPSRFERRLTATEVLRVLGALGGSAGVAPPSTSTRLFRSPVFGRDDILRSLSHALVRAESQGTFWLLAGESGIGKTALAAVVARAAAMSSMRVITGECVPLTPAGAHHRPGLRGPHFAPLRSLLNAALDRAQSHSEPRLRQLLQSLAAYEPRAEALWNDRPEAPPIVIPWEAAKERACENLAELLAELARIRPVLLVLDDIHWADELTMSFLTSFPFDYFERNRVVLVATYRTEQHDELVALLSARPYTEKSLLTSLGENEVRRMVAESCGFEVPESWAKALHEKSGGNPFLVAEYLRASLDESATTPGRDWAMSSAAELLANATGPIEDLIGRRLARLSPRAQTLVQIAAVIGNPIPRRLLEEASEDCAEAVRSGIDELLGRNVLEGVDPQHYRFMHDRLREVAYASLDDVSRRSLHQRIAMAIETHLESGARADAAPVLAHHFARGGDRIRALDYLDIAAEVGQRSFANRAVVSLLTEAISLVDDAVAFPRARMARFLFGLGKAYFGLGMLEESRSSLVRMLAILSFGTPDGRAADGWRCLVALLRQASNRLLGRRQTGAEPRSLQLDAVAAYDMLMQVYFYRRDNVAGMLYCALAGLNLAETLGPSPELRLAYANMQSTAAIFGLRRLAHAYETLGAALPAHESELDSRTSAAIRQCAQHVMWAEWEAAEACATRVVHEARAVAYRRHEEEGVSFLAHIRFAQGRFVECREFSDRLRQSASRGDPQSLCWSMVFQAHTDLVFDCPDAAIAVATEGLKLAERLPGRSEAINFHSTIAVAAIRKGDIATAESHARIALEFGQSASLVVFFDIVPYAYICEVAFELASTSAVSGRATSRRLMVDAFRLLRKCGRLFPLAGPRVALWEGTAHWIARRPAQARSAWKRALTTARSLGTPHEGAHAALRLAQHGGSASPVEAFRSAETAFEKLGATFDQRRASRARSEAYGPLPIAPASLGAPPP